MKGSLVLAILCLSFPGEVLASGECSVRVSLQAVPDSQRIDSGSLPQAFIPDTPSPLRPWFPDVTTATLGFETSPVAGWLAVSRAGREGDRIAALIHEKFQSFRESLSTP